MLFKSAGVILLLLAVYLAAYAFVLVPNDGRLGAEVDVVAPH